MRPIPAAAAPALTGLLIVLLCVVAAPASAQSLTNASETGVPGALVPAAGEPEDDGGGHGEMDMSDTEMTELGHDLDDADHAEEGDDADHEDAAPGDHEDVAPGDLEEEATTPDEESTPHGDEPTTHDGAADGAPSRPRAAVLTTFLLVNAAVLGAAAFLRRRDRDTPRRHPRPGTGASPAAHPA